MFYATHLSGREVEFSVGRYPVKLCGMGQRVLVAQLWRNLDGSYEKMEQRLAQKIRPEGPMTSWLRISIRIAVLFGVFGEILRSGEADEAHPVDVALPAGDFSVNMAVWYARQMGLPIGRIICCCGSNSAVWDLLNLGQMRTGGPEASFELERLIHARLGYEEARRFNQAVRDGGIYSLAPENAALLRQGMFSAVVSNDRRDNTISNVYRTNAYLLEPDAAGAYSALMDHRAKSGDNRRALLLEDRSPGDCQSQITAAMGITPAELEQILEKL